MRFKHKSKEIEKTGSMFMIRPGVMEFTDDENQQFIQRIFASQDGGRSGDILHHWRLSGLGILEL